MIRIGEHNDDAMLAREERELRALLATTPHQEEGPSQAYWDMYATRVMARVARAEEAPAAPRWALLWKPAASLAVMAVAAAAFVMLQPREMTLDQAMAALPAADATMLRQSEAAIVPVSSGDNGIAGELLQVAGPKADVDAVLVFGDTDADLIAAAIDDPAQPAEVYGLDELTDDDANAVLSNLKNSL